MSYLCLDAVEAPEPQDLSAPELALSVVDLVLIIRHVLVHVVVGARARPCLLQAFEVAGWHRGDQLSPGRNRKQDSYVSPGVDRRKLFKMGSVSECDPRVNYYGYYKHCMSCC